MPIGLGFTGGGSGSRGIVEDGLIHRWKLDEETGSTLSDSIGTAHLTAYTGVSGELNGTTHFATTSAALLDSWLPGTTKMFVGGIIRPKTIGASGYLIGGSATLGDYFWLYRLTSGILRATVTVKTAAEATKSVTLQGPDFNDDYWYEFYLTVDLDTGLLTSYHREHTDGNAWSGSWTKTEWTETSNSFADGDTLFSSGGTGEIRVGKRSSGDFFAGEIMLLFIGGGSVVHEDIIDLLSQPTKSLAKEYLGSSAACWLFDAGAGDFVHDLITDGWANSLEFPTDLTWRSDITGSPQAGFRCGERRGGKPGLLLGTADGARLLAHAKAAVYTLADAEDANESSPYTIEVVLQSGFAETNTSNYSMIFGCMAADTGTVGKWFEHRGAASGRNTMYKSYTDYGTTTAQTMYAAPAGTLDVLHHGVFTYTIRTQGNTGGTPVYMVQHHESESVPAVDAAGTNHGRQVDTATANEGGANNSSATYYTVMGNAPTETGTDHPQYSDLIIREVRIYDDCLSDAQLLQNRAADRRRNGGRIWYVDAAAKFNGWGTREAPFNNLTNAIQRMHNGDTVYIIGEIEVSSDSNIPCLYNGTGTTSKHFIGGYRNITVSGDDGATITRGQDYAARTGDVGYGLTDMPVGYSVPHLYDTTTIWSIKASDEIPMESWAFSGIVFDCAELSGHAITAGTSDEGRGSGLLVTGCTIKNTHAWSDEHTAEGVQSSWNNFVVRGCTGQNNRSQLVYCAKDGVAGNVTGFEVSGCVSYDGNGDTFSHYEPTTDAALPDPPDGIDFIESDTTGSAICQIWIPDVRCISPLIYNNFIYGPGRSGIIVGSTDGGYVFNNIVAFEDGAVNGYGFRIGGDNDVDGKDYSCTEVSCFNNTVASGSIGIIYWGSDLVFKNNVFYNLNSSDVYDDSTDTAGPASNTCEYNVGSNDDLGSGTGNIPASTNILIGDPDGDSQSDFAILPGSDGYRSGVNLGSVLSALKYDANGVARGSSWSMGALQ